MSVGLAGKRGIEPPRRQDQREKREKRIHPQMTPMDADQTIKKIEWMSLSLFLFLVSLHLRPSASSADGFSSLSGLGGSIRFRSSN
jgi:hypothetical protein